MLFTDRGTVSLWPKSFYFIRSRPILSPPLESKFPEDTTDLLTISNAEIIPTNGTHFKLNKLVSQGNPSKN